MKVGIVGHAANKFTQETEAKAREVIKQLLSKPDVILVSGHCHLGGIDIWAEEIAKSLGVEAIIFPPKTHNWIGGYRPRNLQIANLSDEVHCIVVNTYPPEYVGQRFDKCYHCMKTNHVKSGGCWTAKQSKLGIWHIIR